MNTTAASPDTRERILVSARRLAQQRGFSAFSYADIAVDVGVRKASIHHHFAAKEDLELALLARYHEDFEAQLARVSARWPAGEQALERLRGYIGLYRATLDAGAICLCGMAASDLQALPVSLRQPLARFFAGQEAWLAETLEAGRRAGVLVFAGAPAARAQLWLASLQGALLVAQGLQRPAQFDAVGEQLLLALRG